MHRYVVAFGKTTPSEGGLTMRKLSPKQKENAKQAIESLISDSRERRRRRQDFLNDFRVLLAELNGNEKLGVFRELQKLLHRG